MKHNKKQDNKDKSEFDLGLITDSRIINPFLEITRRTRKALLLTTFLGYAVTWAGLIPTKIAALGIELSASNLSTVYILIIVALLYFLTAFWIYANTDLISYNIVQQAGKDNIRDSLGKELLENQMSLKSYNETKKNPSDNKPSMKLPEVPPEYFKMAAIHKLMSQPLALYKYVGAKVWFDKNVPIYSAISCLFFMLLKLSSLKYLDTIILLFGLVLTILIAIVLYVVMNRKSLYQRIKKIISNIDSFLTKLNLKVIELQLNKSKKGSWLYKRASKKKVKIAKAAMDRIFNRSKRTINKAKNQINRKTTKI